MQTVKSCCCGCSLRTGTLILLWLGLVLGSLGLLSNLVVAAQANISFSAILFDVIFRIVFIIINIIGICGVQKEKPSYLIPYLTLQVIGLVGGIIMILVIAITGTAILSSLSGQHIDTSAGVGGIILAVFLFLAIEALFYYLFVVVLSFYKELKSGTHRVSA